MCKSRLVTPAQKVTFNKRLPEIQQFAKFLDHSSVKLNLHGLIDISINAISPRGSRLSLEFTGLFYGKSLLNVYN